LSAADATGRDWSARRCSLEEAGRARDSVTPEDDPRDLLRSVLVYLADLVVDVP